MKRLVLVFLFLIIVLLAGALLWWPLPPERPGMQALTRESVIIKLSGEFEPKTTGGFLSWLGVRGPSANRRPEVGTKFASITSTGFASSPVQTDSSPCRTAAGTFPRPGTLAANFLPLGTLAKIRIDGVEIPGVFIVEDRTAAKFGNRIDIWFAQTSQALDFGKRRVEITVVGYGKPGQSLAGSAGEEEGTKIANLDELTTWEKIRLRIRSITEFITTRGRDVNRFDINCLELQKEELNI